MKQALDPRMAALGSRSGAPDPFLTPPSTTTPLSAHSLVRPTRRPEARLSTLGSRFSWSSVGLGGGRVWLRPVWGIDGCHDSCRTVKQAARLS